MPGAGLLGGDCRYCVDHSVRVIKGDKGFCVGHLDQPPIATATAETRHTFATELANADVNVYTLRDLLGHESITTSQRYVEAVGAQTRAAAARNPLYEMLRH